MIRDAVEEIGSENEERLARIAREGSLGEGLRRDNRMVALWHWNIFVNEGLNPVLARLPSVEKVDFSILPNVDFLPGKGYIIRSDDLGWGSYDSHGLVDAYVNSTPWIHQVRAGE